jgi:ribonuclease P protein component
VVVRTSADRGTSRLGITVSARVGNAVVRNRVKRVVREIFRRRRRELTSVNDIVVIAKSGADNLTYAQAATELEQALELAPAR